jgi:hypothetical protein
MKLLKILLKIKHLNIYNIYKAPNNSYSFNIHFSFLFVSHKNGIYVFILFTFLFYQTIYFSTINNPTGPLLHGCFSLKRSGFTQHRLIYMYIVCV